MSTVKGHYGFNPAILAVDTEIAIRDRNYSFFAYNFPQMNIGTIEHLFYSDDPWHINQENELIID